MIEIVGLRKKFAKKEVLRSVNIKIPKGEITALVGPNGCGKTTIIKCILGLVVRDAGEFKSCLSDFSDDFDLRTEIGYMPQEASFPNNLTLKELAHMLEDLRKKKANFYEELVDYFQLKTVTSQPFVKLSGGTRQRALAVIAFMFDPKMIILDEPTAGLDPLSSLRFKDLLRQKSLQGRTILMVSHFMTEVEQLAKNLVYLHEGKVLYSGSLLKLKEESKELSLERALMRVIEGELPGLSIH